MRFAAFIVALLVASMAQAQSLPPPVNDRAATAIDLWMSALTRVEGSVEGGGTYNAWLDRGAPVSVIERRPKSIEGSCIPVT